MTFDVATSMLNRANNGDELLQILESIANDNDAGTVTDIDGTPVIW